MGIIAFVILYRRRRNDKNRQILDSSKENRHLQELIHIDWDRIDKHYKEMPFAASTPEYPQMVASPTMTVSDASTNTKIAQVLKSYNSPSTTHQYYPTDFLGDSINQSSVDDVAKSPDINTTNSVKPSVGEIDVVKPDVI